MPSTALAAPVRARTLLTGAVALAVASLPACGPATPVASSTSSFTGPWAEEFAYADSVTDSEFAHRAFAHSVISDAEAQEGISLILACYDSHGATVQYDAYGYATVEVVTGSEDPLDVMGTCEFADGGVVVLHDQMRLNPDNLDTFTIQAACLVDAGIVEPGYTGQDLEQAFDTGQHPYHEGDSTAMTCMRDPLGLASASDAPTSAATS